METESSIWYVQKLHTNQADRLEVEAGSNTFTVTLRVVKGDGKGSLKSETVKYGTRERLRWQGPAAYTKERPVLSSERAPHMDRTVTFNENKYLVMSPRRGSTPRQTD
jgi:hypothetical protein